MDNVFIITHGNDIDGLASASIVMRKYSVPAKNVFFLDYTKIRLESVLRAMPKQIGNGDLLFVMDFSVDKDDVSTFARLVSGIRKAGGSVFWFDHHFWEPEALNKVAKVCDRAVVGENQQACAAEITALELGMKDTFTRRICGMAHDTDFHLGGDAHPDNSTFLLFESSLAYYNGSSDVKKLHAEIRSIVASLSRQKIPVALLRKAATKYEKLSELKMKDLRKGISCSKRVDMAVGFSSMLSSGRACEAIMKHAGTDIGIYVDMNKRIAHIRSVKADISKLAVMCNGGGHDHAAGFSLESRRFGSFDKKSRAKIVKYIDAMAKRAGLQSL